MKVFFADQNLEELCLVYREANRKLGLISARKLVSHMDRIRAASCLEDLRYLPGHLHELSRDRKFELALSLHGGDRLVFKAIGNDIFKEDGGLDWRKVLEVRIVYVGDYHD